MNPQERQQILERARARQQQQQSEPQSQGNPSEASPQPYIRATGGAEIRVVDENNPPTEVRSRRRQGVVQRQAGPAQTGPKTLGARVVNQQDLDPSPRVRTSRQPGQYGAVVSAGAQAPASLNQQLRTPLQPAAAAPAPSGAPAAPAPPAPNLSSQIQALGAGMKTGAVAPGPMPTAQPATGLVTVIMSQHLRPDSLEKQFRALTASGVSENHMICWVNPAKQRLNDRLLQGIPHVRANMDMGPWMRWTLIGAVRTKYVLIIDDDCIPGNRWLAAAVARLEAAEQNDDPMVIAAAGSILQNDGYDDQLPIGPESLQRQETTVDLGRGAWLMTTELAREVADFPQIGSWLSTAVHVAAAAQHSGASTVVLPYPHNQRDVWGSLAAAQTQGSMSAQFDAEASQGRGPGSAAMRKLDYVLYREVGWEPLCVMQAEVGDGDEDEDEDEDDGSDAENA